MGAPLTWPHPVRCVQRPTARALHSPTPAREAPGISRGSARDSSLCYAELSALSALGAYGTQVDD